MNNAILYIVLIVLAFIIFWRARKGNCGPACWSPKKPTQIKIKTEKERRKEKEELEKRIKREKGKDPNKVDLFSDFIDKEKKKKGGKK